MDGKYDALCRTVDHQLRNTSLFQTSFDIRTDEVILFELLCKVLIVVPTRIPWLRHRDSESYRMCLLSQSTTCVCVIKSVYAFAFFSLGAAGVFALSPITIVK